MNVGAPDPGFDTLALARSGVAAKAAAFVGLAIAGWCLGLLAWGEGRWPAVAVMVPLFWILAPTRWFAGAVGAAYAMATVRFLPALGGTWFASTAVGYALWAAIGLISGGLFALCWPRKSTHARVIAACVILLLAGLLLSVVVPGHAIVGWGYVLQGRGWFGVAAMFVATAALGWGLRVGLPARWPGRGWVAWPLLAALVVLVAVGAEKPDPKAGRVAGQVGSLNTAWGPYPEPGTMEVIRRVTKIGEATETLAGGEGRLVTVVFPEAIIGSYESSLFPVLENEIFYRTRQTGQTVVLGADVMIGRGLYQNAAIILRPDGTSSWIAARQSAPFGQWRPWSPEFHIPSDWLAPSVVALGAGVRARIMFCHEEYMPILHLLSEAREDHNLVIAISNLWAASDGVANTVQSAHTEGMARLFGRPWIRSVNSAAVARPVLANTGIMEFN